MILIFMPIDLFFLLTFEKIVKKSLFYAVSFQFLYEIPNRWRQVLLAKWFCWLCCRVLFLKGKNVVLNAWIRSYMYFILMYFDVKVKKIIRKSLLFVRTHTNKKYYIISEMKLVLNLQVDLCILYLILRMNSS